MKIKAWLVFSLFLATIECLLCAISYRTFQNQCEIHLSDGNLEELTADLSEIRNRVQRCPYAEILFQLKHYHLPAFPNGIFANFKNLSLKVEISDDSSVQLISPVQEGYSIFENSSFSSVIFDISDSSTLIGWNWKTFEGLSPGRGLEFNVVRSKLVYLSDSFNKVAGGRITAIRILKCRLRWLGEEVFAPLANLKTLELRDNYLEKISRSQLPSNAAEMRLLDLGKNRLMSLPEDIFDGLHLQSVFLDGNNLKISEPLMNKILSRGEYYFISGVVWPCNCNDTSNLSVDFKTNLSDFDCYMQEGSNEVYRYKKKCFQSEK